MEIDGKESEESSKVGDRALTYSFGEGGWMNHQCDGRIR